MRGRGVVVVGLALVLGAGALSGCAETGGGGGSPGCVPRMTVAPAVVHPGGTVTFSSRDVCDASVPDGGWKVSARKPMDGGAEVSVRSDDTLLPTPTPVPTPMPTP